MSNPGTQQQQAQATPEKFDFYNAVAGFKDSADARLKQNSGAAASATNQDSFFGDLGSDNNSDKNNPFAAAASKL